MGRAMGRNKLVGVGIAYKNGPAVLWTQFNQRGYGSTFILTAKFVTRLHSPQVRLVVYGLRLDLEQVKRLLRDEDSFTNFVMRDSLCVLDPLCML